jgi:hypothetical protein
MSSDAIFPDLEGFGPTKQTLHLYAQAVGVIPRTHAVSHPKWWHVSLKVRPNGLTTDDMALPDGGSFNLRMDLKEHKVVLTTSTGTVREFSMAEGLTSTALGNQILAALADLGLEGEYARDRFENGEPRAYDPVLAERFFAALTIADRVFNKYRSGLSGDFGQVQLWPHGFDLAMEWFGTRVETYEEHGEVTEYPSQLNLGFYVGEGGDSSYFYSNPWPFEQEQLVHNALPSGARWITESWQGSILPYSELIGVNNAEERLLEYANAVYNISSPTLLA